LTWWESAGFWQGLVEQFPWTLPENLNSVPECNRTVSPWGCFCVQSNFAIQSSLHSTSYVLNLEPKTLFGCRQLSAVFFSGVVSYLSFWCCLVLNSSSQFGHLHDAKTTMAIICQHLQFWLLAWWEHAGC
jgi:hypothetical protein